MVLKKLVFSFCRFFDLRGNKWIRGSSFLEVKVLNIQNNIDEVLSSSSPGGSQTVDQSLEGAFCCICLSRLKEESETRLLPCSHEFHRACIDHWLMAYGKTCPVCRFTLQEEKKIHRGEDLTEEMLIWFSSFHVAGF